MKCLMRNKVSFHFSKYQGQVKIIDDEGYATGEYEQSYSNPIKIYGNISSANGSTAIFQFGKDEIYDKVIVMEEDYGIDVFSHLWVDVVPTISEDGSTDTPYDYIVTRISKSLNNVAIAINKVNVNG